jgi:ribosome-associated protein YbcJ (S4-like RNA binding protein)
MDNLYTKYDFDDYDFLITNFEKDVEFVPKEAPLKVVNYKHRFIRVLYENRSIFRTLFFKKTTPQKKFNKKFFNISKTQQTDLLVSFELNIENILLRSRFLSSPSQVDFFIKEGLVFFNGSVLLNKNKYVRQGDVIQLCILDSYYYFDKTIVSELDSLHFHLPNKIWNFYKHINNIFKQTPQNFENWYYILYYF